MDHRNIKKMILNLPLLFIQVVLGFCLFSVHWQFEDNNFLCFI